MTNSIEPAGGTQKEAGGFWTLSYMWDGDRHYCMLRAGFSRVVEAYNAGAPLHTVDPEEARRFDSAEEAQAARSDYEGFIIARIEPHFVAQQYPWKTTEPPRDRGIWVRANLITEDEGAAAVIPFEGYAEWSEQALDWLGVDGLTIRPDTLTKLRVHDWIEAAERAAECAVQETHLSAAVRYREPGEDREPQFAGWFLDVTLFHVPTSFLQLAHFTRGPFATRTEATAAILPALAELEGRGL